MATSFAPCHWNDEGGGITVSWPKSFEPNPLTSKLFHGLEISVEMDGRILDFQSWSIMDKQSAFSVSNGIRLEVEFKATIIAKVINQSNRTCKLDRFIFRSARSERETDLLSIPGSRLRIYCEGWTMASPAASLRLGESEFKLNPEYKPFAASEPEAYFDSEPNRFSGDSVIVLNDEVSGVSALVGFITSANQLTRIAVAMGSNGITSFEAIAGCDGIELGPFEEVSSEELVVMAGTDGYGLLEEFANLWGKRMRALTWSHCPTGWSSWCYYGSTISERDMLENVVLLKDQKNEFLIEYIQMDDGFQTALGDWLVADKEKFPNGLAYLASEIKAAGFKPALWLAPFLVEECSDLYINHSDWMIKDPNGETLWVFHWRGNSRTAALDCTLPAVTDWLTEVFSEISRMGFDYVKLDFLVHECSAISMGGSYADKKATRAQAFRRGLQAIKTGMGENKFLLGCTAPFGPQIGLVNGARIGPDIPHYWKAEDSAIFKEAPSIANVCRNVINHAYMNGRLWVNDPDTHIARIDHNTLTEDEVILWTSALWLVGGMLLLSDRFSTLTSERAKLSKLLLNELGRFKATRPLDLFEREYPAIWLAQDKSECADFAVGVFNFEDHAQTFNVDLIAAKITPGAEFSATEFWSGETLVLSDSFEASLKPHSSKVYILKTSQSIF